MNTQQMAKVEKLCRSYLTAMESGDLEALLANFADDATATSPIFGRQPARDFYSYVMRVTSARSMTLRTIFIGASDPSRAAIHVAYTRTVGSGKPATIEAVDIFDLTEDHSKFAAVTVIYDTGPVRFQQAGGQPQLGLERLLMAGSSHFQCRCNLRPTRSSTLRTMR